MRSILFTSIVLLFIISCTKDKATTTNLSELPKAYLKKIESYLSSKMSSADYSSIDFNCGSLYKQNGTWVLQLRYSQNDSKTDFLVLLTDSLGNCSNGKFIHLEKSDSSRSTFNGKIIISSLSRNSSQSSKISAGYLECLHPNMFANGKLDVLPDPSETLPEVVVVGYLPTSGSTLSWLDYMSFQSLLGVSAGSPLGGGGGSGAPGGIYVPIGIGGGGSGVLPVNSLNINYENSIYKPGIDINAFMKCFSTIIDQDSQCSVSIFTDLPVNDDPTIFFNWYTGATGHAFLQLTKTRGSQSVTQIVGFTAAKPLQAISSDAPVASKIVDNAGHKYNAFLTMNITPSQLQSEIDEIIFLAKTMQYSITKYNCVDFALQVVNIIRGVNPLIVPKYPIPGQTFSNSNTPEGLYKLLESMKMGGGVESKNIFTDLVLHAGTSHGACN